MEISSPRFKALAVSLGFTFWFFIITSAVGYFSIEIFLVFMIIIFPTMQIVALQVSKALDVFAIYNTKFFLGILFVFVISVYGLLFRILKIDILRTKKGETYWLSLDEQRESRIFKQY